MKEELEQKLKVGTKIRIGKRYSDEVGGFDEGEVITLIEGYFENDNGLYVDTETCPSVFEDGEYESIYHLFGNDFEYWLDCEII